MIRTLFIPAVRQVQAEANYRRIRDGAQPPLEMHLSEVACRSSVATYPPAFRENVRIWSVTERFGPDGPIVVAEDISARSSSNVVAMGSRSYAK